MPYKSSTWLAGSPGAGPSPGWAPGAQVPVVVEDPGGTEGSLMNKDIRMSILIAALLGIVGNLFYICNGYPYVICLDRAGSKRLLDPTSREGRSSAYLVVPGGSKLSAISETP